MFRTLSPLLDRLGKCGLCGVYKMGFWGLGGKRGRGGLREEFLGVLWGRRDGGLLSRGKNAIKSLKASHHQSL